VAAELIEVGEARRLVRERISPLPTEDVPLGGALGRVLAADVRSPESVPGFDNSAMDGFAIRAADTRGASAETPVTLRVTDESRAGHPAAATIGEGDAVRISTGAALPDGADAVVRVEDTSSRDARVAVQIEARAGQNVRRVGEDVKAGEVVLSRGMPLGAAELGVLASIGRASVPCARRPEVSVLTTGDELIAPGVVTLPPGGVRNANAYTVPALAERAGAKVVRVETGRDDPDATRAAIERSLGGDIAVITGGVSVGEHDRVRSSLAQLGVEQVFWGVALRPGKPTWFGAREEGTLVFGLPGNPVSAMVTFLLFTRPAIRALAGALGGTDHASAILDEAYQKKPGRAHAVRCRLWLGDDGWHVRPTKEQGSHVLTSMLGADVLAIIPGDSETVTAGERVEIELLPGVWERWR
jgi:molybdopterin molybdotransferase